jgi:glucosamine--fructose-6-phosphate aminotransferase (isomerizing)
MNVFLEDVLAQPRVIRTALDFYEAQGYPAAMKKLAEGHYDKVVFAGMGSSHYCNFGSAIHLASRGVTAVVKSAGELLHHERGLIDERTLLVMVSQSGESGEVVKFFEDGACPATVVAITNQAGSTLARRADSTFLLHVEPEKSVSTRTYLASVLLSTMLSYAIGGDSGAALMAELRRSVTLLEGFLSDHAKITAALSAMMKGQHYICYLGRGYSKSSSHGGALFTSELAKFPAMAFDAGEFRHGPFEMVDEAFSALVFAPDGPAWEANCRMALDIASHGGKAALVTNRRPPAEAANLLVLEYGAIDESLAPVVEIGAAQLFANAMAESKGLDIGKFRWGSKVTTVI